MFFNLKIYLYHSIISKYFLSVFLQHNIFYISEFESALDSLPRPTVIVCKSARRAGAVFHAYMVLFFFFLFKFTNKIILQLFLISNFSEEYCENFNITKILSIFFYLHFYSERETFLSKKITIILLVKLLLGGFLDMFYCKCLFSVSVI